MTDREIDHFLASLSETQRWRCYEKLSMLIKRGRGRPEGARNKNPVTRQSRLAAQFVRGVRYRYMKDHGLKRVPAHVIDDAIQEAIKIYPEAKDSIIREHVRKSSTYRERL